MESTTTIVKLYSFLQRDFALFFLLMKKDFKPQASRSHLKTTGNLKNHNFKEKCHERLFEICNVHSVLSILPSLHSLRNATRLSVKYIVWLLVFSWENKNAKKRQIKDLLLMKWVSISVMKRVFFCRFWAKKIASIYANSTVYHLVIITRNKKSSPLYRANLPEPRIWMRWHPTTQLYLGYLLPIKKPRHCVV